MLISLVGLGLEHDMLDNFVSCQLPELFRDLKHAAVKSYGGNSANLAGKRKICLQNAYLVRITS